VKIGSFDSMNEGWDDEGNGEEEQEWGDNENRGKNSCQKVSVLGEVWNVSLWMMLGYSL